MASCWIFQDARQKAKLKSRAPWSVGWLVGGKRKSKTIGSKLAAKDYCTKLQSEINLGKYRETPAVKWSDFREKYESDVLSGSSAANQMQYRIAFDHFQRISKPGIVKEITTATIDDYIARRRLEPGAKKGDTISRPTLNKELRCLRAAFNVAIEWKLIDERPKLRMQDEPDKLPTYVTPEHFAAIYQACGTATLPDNLPYPAGDWWQALVVFGYMTGWRVGEMLSLRRADIDLDAATAITRHVDNKGKRDEIVPLHSVIVDHLRSIPSFHPLVFPWLRNRRELWPEFHKIQKAAGIHLQCHERHEHSEGCHLYGFHDLRRAFASCNAATMPAESLQRLMRHKSYETTRRYINMAGQLNSAVANLHVPDVLRKAN